MKVLVTGTNFIREQDIKRLSEQGIALERLGNNEASEDE